MEHLWPPRPPQPPLQWLGEASLGGELPERHFERVDGAELARQRPKAAHREVQRRKQTLFARCKRTMFACQRHKRALLARLAQAQPGNKKSQKYK